jgi:hypothetical protein
LSRDWIRGHASLDSWSLFPPGLGNQIQSYLLRLGLVDSRLGQGEVTDDHENCRCRA